MRSRLLVASAAALIGLVVGVVLVRPDSASAPKQTADPLVPGVITPQLGSIKSVLVLDGVIRPVDPIAVRSSAAGTVAAITSQVGDQVVVGATLFRIGGPDGTIQVRATKAGVISSIAVELNQSIAIGDELGVLAPADYLAQAVVAPELLYRLYRAPDEISLQLDRGPAPFPCPFVSLGVEDSSANPLDAPVYLTCQVPQSTRVFAGMRGRLVVTTGRVDNAITVPVEAVSGSADTGLVWVVGSGGEATPRTVELGLTDGVRIQIVGGLAASDHLLEFPPDDAAP